jgi:phytoene dehydrogenase-like protein
MTEQMRKRNIAVVGAGIGGLSAAYDLVRAGANVTVFEASDRPGGLAAGFKEPHWDWSWSATTIIGSRPISICAA